MAHRPSFLNVLGGYVFLAINLFIGLGLMISGDFEWIYVAVGSFFLLEGLAFFLWGQRGKS